MAPADEDRNHGVLFARAYLNSKLAEVKEGQQAYLLETVKEWFDKTDKSSLKAYVASFVGPVLDVLGHIRGELQENLLYLYSDRSHQKVVALCYVVNADESLDQTVKGRNYAVSLVIALKKVGLKWGILTNGMLWRLYCVKEKAPFETYFQVDLGKVLRARDSREITLFADFFGASVFLPDERSRCRLDEDRHESDEVTREIEQHLESKIESILGKICMGFIESEGRKSCTEEEKRTIFSNSIYLLYRILFVLYAEARGFLPLQNPEYHEKSMENLMNIAKENHSKGIADPHSKTIWNTLRELFDWINQGNRALGIPPYNGGLFDDVEKPYLANHVIYDPYLSEALFNLGFREEKGEIERINYNDPSVRHLGGLYEGILEYQLFIAQERMVRRKEQNAYRYIPESRAGKITRADTVIEKGDIYFSQSSEERKLTGSYYTPENIVQYIVENSLGQYLADIDTELQILISKPMEAHTTAINGEEKMRIERFIDAETLSFLEKKALSVKILDPAMGSGHFLVNAAYFLANHVVESLYFTEWNNDSIDTNPLLWRRQVVEKCIFGVDLNDLATELAKLSLWLITADNKKPLTFLDHHLRTGNSLLGSDLDDLAELPDNSKARSSKGIQTTLNYSIFEKEFIPNVLQVFSKMEVSSENIEDIERKKEEFKQWEKLKKDLQGVADTWLATFFGYTIEQDMYQSLLTRAMGGKEIVPNEKVVEIARASRNNFFHWWLEFPEVFFKSMRNYNHGGFDVVIGNPPYERTFHFENEKKYYSSNYISAYGAYDILVLFIERAIRLLKDQGYLGLIVSNKFFVSDYGKNLREFLLSNSKIDKVVDLADAKRVFPDALVSTVVMTVQKSSNEAEYDVRCFTADENTTTFDGTEFKSVPISKFVAKNGTFNVRYDHQKDTIYEKINQLKKFGDAFGIRTGIMGFEYWDMQPFIHDGKTGVSDIRIATNSCLGRYRFLWGKEINLYKKSFKEPYANIEQLPVNEQTKKLFLTKNKLIVRGVSKRLTAALDSEGIGLLVAVHSVITNQEYDPRLILGIINSKLFDWLHKDRFYLGRIPEGSLKYPVSFLKDLPLPPRINEVDQTKLTELVNETISLNKQLDDFGEKTADQRARIEDRIKEIDLEIDELVCKIYRITEAEKKIIEASSI